MPERNSVILSEAKDLPFEIDLQQQNLRR